ncbi:MAG: aldehyde dehydrogenase family protein [Fidelibacterota bacterium]
MNIKDLYMTMHYGPAPESPASAAEWLDGHDRRMKLFIGGEWLAPQSDQWFDTVNPATEEVLASIPAAGAEDVDRAVAAARQAQPAWAGLPGYDRARHLYALARQIQKHSRLFAVLETLDNGKPIRESRDIDIPLVIRHFYHHAGWAQLMGRELKDYKPVGVVGQIIPWNFPLLMLAWKIAPALVCGNTVVLKPAEFTSLTAFLFAEICQLAGLPAGVVNIISGGGRTGEILARHADIQKIAFTGSTAVGRILRRITAGTQKKLSLELGGKSPFIVFDDADLDSAVEGVVDAIWFNQGQVCCAGSRLLVQENIAPGFYRKLKTRMRKLRIGDPMDKGMDMGAIVASVQWDTIDTLVQQGKKEGTLWQPDWERPAKGYFYPPTLITDVSPAATVAQKEIFGPVLVSMTFRTPQEAIALANNTPYGLAASVWSENINLALDLAPQIKAGTVWINCTNIFDAASGFGGYRESGFGREGGREGLWEYVKPSWLEGLPEVKSQAGPTKDLPVDPPAIDETPKLYIGGKQVRPDGGYSDPVYRFRRGQAIARIGDVGRGNRKDIRNAVEAATKAASWSVSTAHLRSQILYYIGENLQRRRQEFTHRLILTTGKTKHQAEKEFELSLQRLFLYAGWTDKYEGNVHRTPFRNVTLAMPEPWGTVGIVCPDDFPLLGFISTVIPAISQGNRIIAVPSRTFPLTATDFYQVLDTSDVPAGVINIVTGDADELGAVLAAHDGVNALWYFGTREGSKRMEELSASNMKQTWVNHGRAWNWPDPCCAGDYFLRQATQVKNIWIPYGV